MRVLLSEGSGLTSRQVAGRLSELGHEVEVLSSTPLCLTRFARHVRAVHAVPRFGDAPFAWLEAAQRLAGERNADLLFPTQEQVAVLSASQDKLAVPTIVPPFASLAQVQDKVSACRTLSQIGAPQPHTAIIADAADGERVDKFPVFVKRAVSTASSGVRQARDRGELSKAVAELGEKREEGVIVQEAAQGPLAMVQAVVRHGRLIAYHANQRRREGVGGGASLKESIVIPGLREILVRLVDRLSWHGGLSMDVILSERGPLIIDVNPRLVEPGNALRAGVDLVAAMLSLIGGHDATERAPGTPGVLTRQSLIAILGAAAQSGRRFEILREARDALLARNAYAGSHEELTPFRGDPLTALPVLTVLLATLLHPPLWRKFHAGAVGPYALTPNAWRQILAEAAKHS
jgi:glutathione synthase/RimK-type ligase-like ATP-grasp enzyme